jgi:hypothetical protein
MALCLPDLKMVMTDKLDDLLVQLIESHADRVRVLELIAEQRAETERLRAALDMVAEERDAWKARALGLPQAPCRHADQDAGAQG